MGKDDGEVERKDADLEPVAFHGDSPMQIQEDMHTFKLKGAIELTVLDETLCIEFLEKRKPWLGVCYTKEHMELLRKQTIRRMWQKFSDEKSDHYKPALASILYKAGVKTTKPSTQSVQTKDGKKPGTRVGRTLPAKRRRSGATVTVTAAAKKKSKKAWRAYVQFSHVAIA